MAKTKAFDASGYAQNSSVGVPDSQDFDSFYGAHSTKWGTMELSDEERDALRAQGLNDHSYQQFLEANGDYGKPTVMSDKEFNAYIKANGLSEEVIHRGANDTDSMSSADMHRDLMGGDKYYVGRGIYGQGIYFSQDVSTAKVYATIGNEEHGLDTGSRIRAVLKPGSKVADYDTIYNELNAKGYKAYDSNIVSAYARSKGYDAIVADHNHTGEIYTNVINRSALVISDKIHKVK